MNAFDIRIYLKSGNIVNLNAMEKFHFQPGSKVSWKGTKKSREVLLNLAPEQIEAVTYTVIEISDEDRYPDEKPEKKE